MLSQKKILALTLILVLVVGIFPVKTKAASITAVPTSSKVFVNGKEVSFDAYNIGGSNYFKLRDIAYALNGTKRQFDIIWNDWKKVIDLISNEPYNPIGGEMTKGDGQPKNAVPSNSPIYKDGVEIKLNAYNIGGNNYFKLRDLGEAFNFDVSWDDASKSVSISTNTMANELQKNIDLGVVKPLATKPRVVINGKVHEVNGYLINDEYYFKPQHIEQFMSSSSKPFKEEMLESKTVDTVSFTVENCKYTNINYIAKTMNFSCTHDMVLDAVYIWTDFCYDEDLRMAEEEIYRADKLGFVPLSLRNDLNSQITFKEFCEILSNVINTYDSELIPQWDAMAKEAAVADIVMTRGDGMTTIFEAAVVMGQNTYNAEWGELHRKIGEKCWDELSNRNMTLFPNMLDKGAVEENPEFSYEAASYFYSFGRQSLVTGKTLFDFDKNANSMLSDRPFTREDAIKAVIRLFESISTEIMVPLSELLDTNMVTYDKLIITDKLLAKANGLPKVTNDNIPYWTGFTYGFAYKNDLFERIKESDIRNMANWGFNSVRVYLDYRDIFNDDVTEVNLYALQTLDRVISYSMKYNVHINLVFIDMPGWWTEMQSDFMYTGSLDFFTSNQHQLQVENMWKLLAIRYKSIPNSILSFDPIFEPENYTRSTGDDIIKNKNYTTNHMINCILSLIKAIKSVSPERLVIFGGNACRDLKLDPLEEAAKEAGALIMANYAADPYIYWNWNIYQTDDRVYSGFQPEWPMTRYYVQTEIAGESYYDQAARNTPITFKGELVEDTVFDFYVTKVCGNGTFIVTADGKEIYKEDIFPQVGKDGCISKENGDIFLYRTDDSFSYQMPHAKSDKRITFSIDKGVKELKISFNGPYSNFIKWSEIDVTLPERYSVERWWSESYYDAHINGTEPGMFKRKTSQIIIEPVDYDKGSVVTIYPDVTFSTENTAESIDKKYINQWLEARIKQNDSDPIIVRFECAFSGKVGDNIVKYYDDMLSVFKSYSVSWFNNDFHTITAGEGGSYTGDELVQYGEYGAFDPRIIKVLQKYQ